VVNQNINPNEFDDQLRHLIQETCGYPKDSLNRKQGLNRIIYLMQKSGKIWRGGGSISLDDYEDALQQSWLFFCRNLCEAVTANQPYNPEKASAIAWFNNHLKYRLKDAQQEVYRKEIYWGKDKRVFSQVDKDTGELTDPIDNIDAPPENPPSMIEELQEWLESNKQKLSRIHLRDRPEINCYILIPRRLPPEPPWKTLEQEFGVSMKTLANFYQRHCLPLLEQWAISQGYLDD
jgi:hypothetical protein